MLCFLKYFVLVNKPGSSFESTFACSVLLITHCPTPSSVVKPLMIPQHTHTHTHTHTHSLPQGRLPDLKSAEWTRLQKVHILVLFIFHWLFLNRICWQMNT